MAVPLPADSVGAHHAHTIGADLAALARCARQAIGAAAIEVCLVGILYQVVAMGGIADSADAQRAHAIALHRALHFIGALRTIGAAAIDVGLHSILDPVFALGNG